MDLRIQNSNERVINDVNNNPIFSLIEPNNISSNDNDDFNDSKLSSYEDKIISPRRNFTLLNQNESINTSSTIATTIYRSPINNSAEINNNNNNNDNTDDNNNNNSVEINKSAEISFKDVFKLKHILYIIYFTL